MNVPTMQMDPALAQAKLEAIRAETHRDAREINEVLDVAYEALGEGLPVLSLSKAIQAGGFFPEMRPKIAIARSDRPEVCFQWSGGHHSARFDTIPHRRGRRAESDLREVHLGRTHGQWHRNQAGEATAHRTVTGYTLVPIVPADVRPKVGQLRDWFTLFEVDVWYDRRKHMQAPVDPILLKHLTGDFYAVLAEWNLTEIERAILEDARRV